MATCPTCETGQLKRDTRAEVYEYKGKSVSVNQPGRYCDNCDEAILSPSDIASTRREIHDFHARVDGLLQSDEVRQIRESLGLTQSEAGNLLGGGPNAFSRYETGVTWQSKATDSLLRLMKINPAILLVVQAIRNQKFDEVAALSSASLCVPESFRADLVGRSPAPSIDSLYVDMRILKERVARLESRRWYFQNVGAYIITESFNPASAPFTKVFNYLPQGGEPKMLIPRIIEDKYLDEMGSKEQ